MLMAVMGAASRSTPWTTWPVLRVICSLLLGVGMSCAASLYYHDTQKNEDHLYDWLEGPWIVPTLAMVWGVVQIFTHVGGATPLLFKNKIRMINWRRDKQKEFGGIETLGKDGLYILDVERRA